MNQTESLRTSVVEGNPLFLPFGPPTALSGWRARLEHRPLAAYDLRAMSRVEREILVDGCIEQHFVVTPREITICADLQALVYGGLVARDPRNAANRHRLGQMQDLVHGKKKLAELPWFPGSARGMIISGEMGTKKTTIARRFRETLGPSQFIHIDNPEAGWKFRRQLGLLYVQLSSDGSRGGLLDEILATVDVELGTDYLNEYKRLSVERKMIRVAERLAHHYCAGLLLDEVQPENFRESSWQGVLCLFFLRLMNFGVPVVLIGNPLAFEDVRSHTQLLSRLTSGGDHRLRPYPSPSDPAFRERFLPGLWEFDVLGEKTPLDKDLIELHFNGSGGVARHLATIRRRSQTFCLREERERLTIDDVKHAVTSLSKEMQIQVRGYVERDAVMLSRFTDLPWEEYKKLWKPRPDSDPRDSGGNGSLQPSEREPTEVTAANVEAKKQPISNGSSPSKKLAAAFKSAKTKAVKRAKKVAALAPKLSPDDMRGRGATAFHLGALDDLLRSHAKQSENE